MKQFSMVVLCCMGAALAIAPSARATTLSTTYDFTYTGTITAGPTLSQYGDTVTLDGSFTIDNLLGADADGGYAVTDFTASFADNGSGLAGTVALLYNFADDNWGPTAATYEQADTFLAVNQSMSPASPIDYDNLFYPNGTPSPDPGNDNLVPGSGAPFDQMGLLLLLPNGDELNFWMNQTTGLDSELWEYSGQNTLNISTANISVGSFTVAQVALAPEPSSLLLLGTGLFGLSFVALRRAKSANRSRGSLSRS